MTAKGSTENPRPPRGRCLNAAGWIQLGCAVLLAVCYWHDPALLAVTLLPQLAAIVGYPLWRGDLQDYYYLSLMPAAVVTMLLGATALVPVRIAHVVGMALLVGAVAIVPARLRFAASLPRLPACGHPRCGLARSCG